MSDQQRKWRIEGVDKESGLEVRAVVTASSLAIAQAMARQRNIEVAEIIDVDQESIQKIASEFSKSPAQHTPEPPKRRRGVICSSPNCGATVVPVRRARGSTFVLIFLLLFFLIPGILYWLFRGGYRYYCPKCGIQLGNDN